MIFFIVFRIHYFLIDESRVWNVILTSKSRIYFHMVRKSIALPLQQHGVFSKRGVYVLSQLSFPMHHIVGELVHSFQHLYDNRKSPYSHLHQIFPGHVLILYKPTYISNKEIKYNLCLSVKKICTKKHYRWVIMSLHRRLFC